MKINVLTELRQPIGAVSTIDVLEERHAIDDLLLEELRGSARLLRTDRGLLVTFHGSARCRAECSRCLGEATEEFTCEFEEEYMAAVDPATGAVIREDVDPDAFRISRDFTLDLSEGVRQYLLISEPLKPLCKADCRGLCPACGANLNTGVCSCADLDERARISVANKQQ